MTFFTTHRGRALAATLSLALTCVAAHAQQTPITGQMLAPTAPAARSDAAPASAPVAAPMPAAAPTTSSSSDESASSPTTHIGDVTHQLLSMQAQGTQAGKHLSIPGQEASASYQRYLKSFEHPIPEFYETAVNNGKGSASSDSSGMP